MYTIYKGKRTIGNLAGDWKVGCDEAYPNRPLHQQLTDYYILEEHEDEMVASAREVQLQIEHNVPVDQFPYHLRKVSGSRGGETRAQQESFQNLARNTWDRWTPEEKEERNRRVSEGKKGTTASDEAKSNMSSAAKLFDGPIIEEIRNDIREYAMSYRAISRKYNCSVNVIYHIRDGVHGY
tara:strand:- start:27 stop:569 length:543 start_codon:yes stop_codon:yes gene_type:complete